MKILIVAATWMEVKMLVDELEKVDEKSHLLKIYRYKGVELHVLIGGIGSTFTAFHLANVLHDSSYDLVLNIGIAGSFTKDLGIGEVVNVHDEQFGDLGIEKQEKFLTLFESGFMDAEEFPFENGMLKATFLVNGELKNVRGITTNKSHGREASIEELKEKFSVQVESMEGAAVFYVCKWLGVKCCQIRAISNYVEPRDPSKWDIPKALENLKNSVLNLLKNLVVEVK